MGCPNPGRHCPTFGRHCTCLFAFARESIHEWLRCALVIERRRRRTMWWFWSSCERPRERVHTIDRTLPAQSLQWRPPRRFVATHQSRVVPKLRWNNAALDEHRHLEKSLERRHRCPPASRLHCLHTRPPPGVTTAFKAMSCPRGHFLIRERYLNERLNRFSLCVTASKW
jgi:hypothetical protein